MRHLCALSLSAILASVALAQSNQPLPRKGVFGAGVGPVTAEAAKSNNLRPGEGQLITRIIPAASAEKAGIKVGDILLSINKKPVGTAKPLTEHMRYLVGNQPITCVVLREGKRLELRGILLERPRQTSSDFEVEYHQVVSRGKRIRVITTYPKGAKAAPAVMLIGGIGAYSVDGNFETVAYGNVMGPISKAGFATIRIDKPGQGDSEGPTYTELKFSDELDAYLQALRFAKTLPYINPNRIGVFGHSMGGVFGPLMAAQEPVAALAVSGTVTKTWAEYNIENTRRQSALSGAKAADLDTEMRQTAAITNYLYYEGLSPAQVAKRHPELAAMVKAMIPDGKTYSGVGLPFFQELARQNVPKAYIDAKTQVLALYCENDFISTRFDHEYLAELVNQARPGTGTFKLLPNSDHGFFTNKSMLESMTNWSRGGSAHNPNIEEALIEWFTKVLKG